MELDIDPDVIIDKELDEQIASEAGYQAEVAIIRAIGSTVEGIMTYGLRRALQDKGLRGALRSGIMSYLFAAGFLSFAGREINRESITAVTKALGLTPNEELIEKVMGVGLRSHLIYVYIYYFLIAIGREPTEDALGAVVKSLGMEPDKIAILETFGFIKGNMD